MAAVLERQRWQRKLLDRALRVFFLDAPRVALTRPPQAWFFFRTVLWQRREWVESLLRKDSPAGDG